MASARVALTVLLTLVPCQLVAADLGLLTVLERIGPNPIRNETCAKGDGQQVSYSRVTVFETHEVAYEYSDFRFCFGQRFIPPVHMRWDSPDTKHKLVFRRLLPDSKFHELRAFLDKPEVKTVESFMNAAPIWHEFDISIARTDGRTQHIPVVAFSPSHGDLQHDPTLVLIVCQAKTLEQYASNGEATVPDYCRKVEPSQGKR